jgi:hypothetical protein
MVLARPLKRCAIDSRNLLQQATFALIVELVLDYVGPGHWCFVAEVSSLWRDTYKRVASREMQVIDSGRTVTSVPQMTLYSSVFGSPSRVRLAKALGLSSNTTEYQRAAGRYANVATLQAAHAAGMRYSYEAMDGAARCNDLTVVQFLRAQGCPWDSCIYNLVARRGHTAMCAYLYAGGCPWSTRACNEAARNGHADTLRWLYEHGCPCKTNEDVHVSAARGGSVNALVFLQQQGIVFTADMLRDMLNVAGAHSKLAAAAWLREQGAQWPAELKWYEQPWSDDAVAWARAEGCTSPLAADHTWPAVHVWPELFMWHWP